MDVENKRRSRAVPSFGRWEYYKEDMCFSECFERARQRGGGGGGIHLSAAAAAAPCNSTQCYAGAPQDNDLYVAGDLYHNDFVTPAMIVVPRHTNQRDNRNKQVWCMQQGKARYPHAKDEKKEEEEWVVCDYDVKRKVNTPAVPISPKTKPPKAVDEDLYKISPHQLLYAKSKKKRGFGLLSCCLTPL